jgi:hypothetical protein
VTDGALRRLFWRVADAVDHLLTLAWLRILNALAGPEPEMAADPQREWDREWMAGRSCRRNGRRLYARSFLLRLGLSPQAKVLDLKSRLRCRGCGARGRAVVSVRHSPNLTQLRRFEHF